MSGRRRQPRASLGLGRMDQARYYLERAASIDLDDSMGNSAQGVHMAAAGGLWQAVIFGFAGFRSNEDTLMFEPHLLPEWKSLAWTLLYRGRRLEIVLRNSPGPCEFVLTAGDAIWIQVGSAERQRLNCAERRSL